MINILAENFNDACFLPIIIGRCRGHFPKWGFDRDLKNCTNFTYGGCDGNTNQFESQLQCEEWCLPKPQAEESPILSTNLAIFACLLLSLFNLVVITLFCLDRYSSIDIRERFSRFRRPKEKIVQYNFTV